MSLDCATVESIEHLALGEASFELVVKQFINAPERPCVSVCVILRRTSGGVAAGRVRIDYGIDASAVNEYLGNSPWLVGRYYRIEECRLDVGSFIAIVAADEHRLVYEVRVEPSPLRGSAMAAWRDSSGCCAVSTTFDFSDTDRQHLSVHWEVHSASTALHVRNPQPLPSFFAAESEHRARWAAIWRAHHVEIDTDRNALALGMKYAVFQLLQHGIGPCVSENGFISPARGLTSTYHSGAAFFDTELHKCIFWIWNDPAAARAFIDYRYCHLKEAIEFAEASGFAGARFPEASNDRGRENGPRLVLSYPCADIAREWSVDEALHISADVCYAVHRYWTVTDDGAYMHARGSDMVMECARFCASAFKWSESKQAYVIDHVMGPDEYHYHVNNSFYTNYMLRWCIRFALSLIDRGVVDPAGWKEVEHWRAVASKVYLPWMVADGVSIPEEFDGYAGLPDTPVRAASASGPRFVTDAEQRLAERLENFPGKAIKQADVVLLLALFPQDFSHEVKRAALSFYEPRTVHDSSLSYGPHAMLAADVGDLDAAARFIERASRYNLDFTVVSDYGNGLHLSAYAGAWQGLVEGMAGMSVDGDELRFRPQLPEQWNSYRFVISFRGRRLTVTVPATGVVRVEHDGKDLPVDYCSDGQIFLRREHDFLY